MEKELGVSIRINSSTKWTFVTEVATKIVTPVTNMILARLLTPDAFGIMATIQMVLAFAEMLADAGFQKFVVQHEYNDDVEKEESVLVAIYTNVFLSFVVWLCIVFFREEIATLAGSPGLGYALAVASCAVPMVAFCSVQLAVMRRNFEFKRLLYFRLIMVVEPLLVAVPLAFFGYGYWALIIGFVGGYAVQSLVVLFGSSVRLRWFYSFQRLREMFAFSMWSFVEAFSIWLTAWSSTFIVGHFLTKHYLGIYRMSGISVNALLGIVGSSVIPVLYSSLSRLQNNREEYCRILFLMQRRTSLLLIPLGVGVFVYRDLARQVLFGSQWVEADMMIGLTAVMTCVVICTCYFCSEVYRSLGSPRVSTLVQVLHVCFVIPVLWFTAGDFNLLVWSSNLVSIQFILVHFIMMAWLIKINPLFMFANTWHYYFAATIMGLFGYYSRIFVNGVWYDWGSILLCVVVYFGVLCLWSQERDMLLNMWRTKKVF